MLIITLLSEISDLALNNLLGIHENILIQFNTVSNAYEPIHATGNATPTYYDVNLVIANNTVSDYNGSSITSAGIATYYQSAPVISANFISGSLGGTNELFGILSNTSPNTIIRANSITNLSADLAVAGIVTVDAVSLIENNKITNITTTSEDYEATGIIKSGAANASTIYNNRIANINAQILQASWC